MTQTQRLFIVGLVIALLGVQLRMVDRYILNQPVSTWLEKHYPAKPMSAADELYVSYPPLEAGDPLDARRTWEPPDWLGWSLLSVGVVLVLTCPVFRG